MLAEPPSTAAQPSGNHLQPLAKYHNLQNRTHLQALQGLP